ncbi:MAG: hypothetical protein N4A47_05930 [Clostridia bacterium]|jgi:hypothetical protein|nr:hypothetical protein [Clostridia bacterium]
MNDIVGNLFSVFFLTIVYLVIVTFPIKQYMFLEKTRYLNFEIKSIVDEAVVTGNLNERKISVLKKKINKMDINGKIKIIYYKKRILYNENNNSYSVLYEYSDNIENMNKGDKIYMTFEGKKHYIKYGGYILNEYK